MECKLRLPKKKQIELPLNTHSVRVIGLYDKYKAEHPDSRITKKQFAKVVSVYFIEALRVILEGATIKIKHGIKFRIVRARSKVFLLNYLSRRKSTAYKVKLMNCGSCDKFVEDTYACAFAKRKRFIYTLHTCPKSPGEVTFKSKDYPDGVDWLIPETNKYYATFIMDRFKARIKNLSIYDFVTTNPVKRKLYRMDDNIDQYAIYKK